MGVYEVKGILAEICSVAGKSALENVCGFCTGGGWKKGLALLLREL